MNECCYAARDIFCRECTKCEDCEDICTPEECAYVSERDTIIAELQGDISRLHDEYCYRLKKLTDQNNALKIMLNAYRQKWESQK